MKSIQVALSTEFMKLRRSGILWISIGIFIFMPMMMGLMIFVARHPETAAKLGLIGVKANMFGNNDWQGYLSVLTQAGGGLGLVGTAFVAAYVFGREYTERTLKDLLALPISRTAIVLAKFIVISCWSALLLTLLYLVGIIMGKLMGLSDWQPTLISTLSAHYITQSILTILLCTPVAYFACIGRGIIAPLGFSIGTLILSNFVGLIGLGPYFPWSIPALSAMHSPIPGMQVGLASYIILAATVLLGFWATLRHWLKADHH